MGSSRSPLKLESTALAVALLILGSRPGAAETIRVPGDFAEIQAAIDAAQDGDTVLVAPGEYVITSSLSLSRPGEPRKDIVLRGGGAPEDTVIRMAPPPLASRGYSVVVFENGETRETRLESLTLTGGRGRGGGVRSSGASPTLASCRIVENHDEGLAVFGGSPLVVDCTIAGHPDGGVLVAGDLVARNTRIERNYGFSGGGVYVRPETQARFEGCVIDANAGFEGGGVYCWGDRTVFTDTVISNNWSQEGGGGARVIDGSESVFDRCTFIGNLALHSGGALHFKGAVGTVLRNCVTAGNNGGIHCREGAAPLLVNCTVSRNFGNPLFCASGGAPRLLNTIVWGNYHSDEICGEVIDSVFSEDSRFVRPGEFFLFGSRWLEVGGECCRDMPDLIRDPGDYRLEADSPAIDAGRSAGAPPLDRDGNGRPCGGGIDIGAYERGDCPPPAGPRFRRGDTNGDEALDLSDPVSVLNFLFLGDDPPDCRSAADTNDSGEVDLSDPVHLLNHLFLGGRPPAAPFGACGLDPTLDELPCEEPAACRSEQ